MRRSVVRRIVLLVAFVGCLSFASPAKAASILFLEVNASLDYNLDGTHIANMLSAAGHTVTYRLADAAIYADYASFSQVWVYDLSFGADNSLNMLGNYANIAAWYTGLSNRNLIADGRIISSGPRWAGGSGEVAWIQNYAAQLDARGGGLVLGTDHNDYHAGINTINQLININPFTGVLFPTQAVVDPLSPLFVPGLVPCGGGQHCINDNSSPGFTPTGAQPNGQFLTPVAYHGTVNQAFNNAAVSSTIGSQTFGTEPVPEPATLTLLGIGLGALAIKVRRARRR